MKSLACTVGLSAILLTAVSAQAQRASDAAAACYNLDGHASALDCLKHRETQSAAAVKEAERAFRAALTKSDEDPPQVSRAVETFEMASQQYQRYRQVQCDSVAALAFGGNAAVDRRLLCQIEMDGRRVADLAAALEHGV